MHTHQTYLNLSKGQARHKGKTVFAKCTIRNIFISKMKTTTVYRVTFLAFLLKNLYDTHNLLKPSLQYCQVPVNGTCLR